MTTSYSKLCKWCGDEIIDYGRRGDTCWIHSSSDTVHCNRSEGDKHIAEPREES